MCTTCPPQVIITEADAAMTSSAAELLPHTKHLYCSWYMSNTFRRKCGGNTSTDLNRKYTAASFATSKKVGPERRHPRVKLHLFQRPCECHRPRVKLRTCFSISAPFSPEQSQPQANNVSRVPFRLVHHPHSVSTGPTHTRPTSNQPQPNPYP